MSKFKVGDEVVVIDQKHGHNFDIGEVVKITEIDCDSRTPYRCDGKNDYWFLNKCEIKHIKDFKTSNRYKLHKYILNTGFTKQDLSLALNKNQSYLTTETRESQFTNRGDMSDARYKSLRKKIKEAVQIKSEPIDISVVGGEVNQTFLDVEPQEKINHKKLEVNINGQVFDFSPDESVSIEITKKPSNNGAFILGLVFFVMLIIFGIGCLIYKAA